MKELSLLSIRKKDESPDPILAYYDTLCPGCSKKDEDESNEKADDNFAHAEADPSIPCILSGLLSTKEVSRCFSSW